MFTAKRPTIVVRLLNLLLLVVLGLTVNLAMAPTHAHALDDEEQRFLIQINGYRAQNGVGALTPNQQLADVAGWMATDLASNNYFSHIDSLGRDTSERTAGILNNTWSGENLAAGIESSSAAFELWHDSPPHNENMLDARYTSIGIKRAYSAASDFGWYWVAEFAAEDSLVVAARDPSVIDEAAPPLSAPGAPPAESSAVDEIVVAETTLLIDTNAGLVLQPVTVTPPFASNVQPNVAVSQSEQRHRGNSGLLVEGDTLLDFGRRLGGSFLSALLKLAPAAHRAFSSDAHRLALSQG